MTIHTLTWAVIQMKVNQCLKGHIIKIPLSTLTKVFHYICCTQICLHKHLLLAQQATVDYHYVGFFYFTDDFMFILPAPQSWFSGYTGLWPGFSVCPITWQRQTFQKAAAQKDKSLFPLRILGLFSTPTWPTQLWEKWWLLFGCVHEYTASDLLSRGNKSHISDPCRVFIQKQWWWEWWGWCQRNSFHPPTRLNHLHRSPWWHPSTPRHGHLCSSCTRPGHRPWCSVLWPSTWRGQGGLRPSSQRSTYPSSP